MPPNHRFSLAARGSAGRPPALVILLATVTFAACSSGGSGTAGTSTAAATTASGGAASTASTTSPTDGDGSPVVTAAAGDASALDEPAATAIITAADPADPAALGALDAVIADPATLAAATAILNSDPLPAGGTLWGATYVYSLFGRDPAPLARLLTDETPGVSLMAAAGLVSTGDASGFPVLVEALTHEGHMPGWDTPLTKWQYAASVLVGSTANSDLGPPKDAESTRLATAQQKWREWLTTTLPTLHFDEGNQLWVAA